MTDTGSRLRILQVSNGFPPTAIAGTESHTYALCQQLQTSHTVHVFCREADLSRPEYTVAHDRVDGIPVTRVVNNLLDVSRYEELYQNARIEQIFADLLDEFAPDLIHFQHGIGLSSGCMAIARERRLPYVVTLHDYWFICPTVNLLKPDLSACIGTHHDPDCFECIRLVPPAFQSINRVPGYQVLHRAVPSRVRQQALHWMQRVPRAHRADTISLPMQRAQSMRGLLASSAALIIPSAYVKDRFIEFGIAPDLIHIIPLGMNAERWTRITRSKRSGAPLCFGYVGTLAPQKGIETMVRAFLNVRGDAELRVYGFEPSGQVFMQRIQREAAADPRIRFMGAAANEHLPEIFAQFDALLMPTLAEETFSFTVREALLAGLPVIASRKGAIPDVVQDGVNGRLLPAADVEAWTACLRELIESPQQLDELARTSASLRVTSHADNAAAHIALYRQVLAQSSAPSAS